LFLETCLEPFFSRALCGPCPLFFVTYGGFFRGAFRGFFLLETGFELSGPSRGFLFGGRFEI
jgi:hypothetical protein